MARIRNIKPDFFRHGDLYDLDKRTGLPVRLLYIALWTVCDKEGRFRWRVREMRFDLMPYDSEEDLEACLKALFDGGFVTSYEVEGARYGLVPTFKKHQRISGREVAEAPRFPGPVESKSVRTPNTGSTTEAPRKQRGSVPEAPRKHRKGERRTENGVLGKESGSGSPRESVKPPAERRGARGRVAENPRVTARIPEGDALKKNDETANPVEGATGVFSLSLPGSEGTERTESGSLQSLSIPELHAMTRSTTVDSVFMACVEELKRRREPT